MSNDSLPNLLFVQTDPKIIELHANRLGQYCRVLRAGNGLAAMRLIREYQPRIIISEYDLPLLSGKMLIKFARRYPATADARFWFLSRREFVPEALNLGANGWLTHHWSSPEIMFKQILKQTPAYV